MESVRHPEVVSLEYYTKQEIRDLIAYAKQYHVMKYPQLLAFAKKHYGERAAAKDTYYGFINWANDIVRARRSKR